MAILNDIIAPDKPRSAVNSPKLNKVKTASKLKSPIQEYEHEIKDFEKITDNETRHLSDKDTSEIRDIITSLKLDEESQKYDTPNGSPNKDNNLNKN